MFKINSTDPLASLFAKAAYLDFPQQGLRDHCTLVDLLSYEIVGTNKIRLGPKPSPESFVEMRKTISTYVKADKPIPFMIPWGSEKPDGSGIDLAELAALKTLKALQARISSHYQPGAQFNIRIEDASAPHLFYFRADEARKEAALYTSGFVDLLKILQLDFIKPKPESWLISENEFNADADNVLGRMIPYVNSILAHRVAGEAESEAVRELGWKSELTIDTCESYLAQYDKMYPSMERSQKVHILARYFSGALSRGRLKLRGDEAEWNGDFLDLTFVQAAPGSAQNFPRRVYYRTCPENMTSNHIPAWRAKGYFKVSEDGDSAVTKLASFNALPPNLHSNVLTFSNGTIETNVTADYIL